MSLSDGIVAFPVSAHTCLLDHDEHGFDQPQPVKARLIAEAGRCENDPDWAVRAAQAAAKAGFWGFKVQLLDRDRLCSKGAEGYGVQRSSQWDELAGRMPDGAWKDVADCCADLGLVWFASCWDEQQVDLALELGAPLLKVGSADITHELLLRYIAGCRVPVILSCGGSFDWEIQRAVEWLDGCQVDLAACTLSYPCAVQDAHLGRIGTLQALFPDLTVGYSDHCAEPWVVGEAVRAGARFVEVHWTVTPGLPGDHRFALHPGNVGRVGDWDAACWDAWGDGRLVPCEAEWDARRGARRSVCASVPLDAGVRWMVSDMVMLRAGVGVPACDWRRLLGRPAGRDYNAGEAADPRDML